MSEAEEKEGPRMINPAKDDRFFYLDGRFYINAEDPGALELIKRIPTTPAVNKPALELITELLSKAASAEAKVELLKKAIQYL